MKKISIVLIALFACTMAFAGNSVKIISGKGELKNLSKQGIPAKVSFIWDGATYDTDEDLKSKLEEDYDFVVANCEENFIEGFNDKAKSSEISKTNDDAKYEYVVTVSNLDMFFNVMAIPARYSGNIWGSIKVVYVPTGETIAEIDFEDYRSGNDFVQRECYGKSFKGLGEEVAKL